MTATLLDADSATSRPNDEPAADLLLSAREVDIRSRVRDIVDRTVGPRAVDADRTTALPSYQALARADLAGMLVPGTEGGTGETTRAYAVAVEEIAAACGSTSTIYATQMHAAIPLLAGARYSLRQQYLPGLCRGALYGSVAITEPDTGSDAVAMRTTAILDGDAYVLDGMKCFISSAPCADMFVVFASVDRSLGAKGIAAFCVDRETPGLTIGAPLDKTGMRGSPTADVELDHCRVPLDHRIGVEAWPLLLGTDLKSGVSAAAQGAGLARGAFEAVSRWAASRRHIGRRPGGGAAPDIQFVLADIRARVLASRLMLYQIAAVVDTRAGDVATAVAQAKRFCTDTAVSVTQDAMRIMDDEGDLEVGRMARDAKVTQIYDDADAAQRLLVACDMERRLH